MNNQRRKKMRSLIIGMGIGQLYKSVLTELGHEVVTVDHDITKNADFPSVNPAILVHGQFDTVHICTPNFTHEPIARSLAPFSSIIFIEKPGFKTSQAWNNLVNDFPDTRFMMVKNNMWRDNIDHMKELAEKSKFITIQWCNKDRVPNPGSWFTTKELAFGGVSRDLMPHLLSLYVCINDNWRNTPVSAAVTTQEFQLKDLLKTEYGVVNPNGTYDVDDQCRIEFDGKFELITQWRTKSFDRRSIQFRISNKEMPTVELGLCPEYAYKNMIQEAVEKKNDVDFWKKQLEIDLWIHQQIENL